jgi:hypothetical protein
VNACKELQILSAKLDEALNTRIIRNVKKKLAARWMCFIAMFRASYKDQQTGI